MTTLLLAVTLFIGQPEGRLLVGAGNRAAILDQGGAVVWEFPGGNVHDAWMLPNGNVLFGDGKAITEVAPDKKTVFQFKSQSSRGDAVYACQRLANGNTLVGENATGRILEVDPTGKIVFTLQTPFAAANNHHNMRMARKLDNGNYLVSHSGKNLVREYKPDGAVVMEIKAKALAFAAIRTPQDTTLVASLGQITEYDKTGKEIWEFNSKTDAPDVVIRNMTGIHLLPNGNIVTGCYSAYGKDGSGTGMLEISRDKKIAWRFANQKLSGSIMAVQLLTPDGKPLPGVTLR
jgi:hypothetical protein